jgi:hypothetical protein
VGSVFTSTAVQFGDINAPAPIPYALPVAWQEIAYFKSEGPPRPVTAHVNVYSLYSESQSEGAGIPARTVELPAGLPFPNTSNPNQLDCGRLRFSYGSQRAPRAIVTDLKSGSYQLPPSESVRIEAHVNGGAATDFADACIVSSACTEGWQAAPARPVFTYQGVLDPSEVYNNSYPDGARWVALFASAASVGGATEPELQFRSPLILLDYVNSVFVPPVQPVELPCRYNVEGWQLENRSAANQILLARVRFYLEF